MHLISVVGQCHTHILCQKYFTGPGIFIKKEKPTGYSSQKDLITIHNSILRKNVINKHMIFCKFLPTIQIVHRSNDPNPISTKIY